jgi:hypothetical protein
LLIRFWSIPFAENKQKQRKYFPPLIHKSSCTWNTMAHCQAFDGSMMNVFLNFEQNKYNFNLAMISKKKSHLWIFIKTFSMKEILKKEKSRKMWKKMFLLIQKKKIYIYH